MTEDADPRQPDYVLQQRVERLRDYVTLRPNYQIAVVRDTKGVYLQVRCWRPDTFTDEWGWGHGGKAYVSQYAVDSEIVQTMFGLYKGYDEHECRETFLYIGRRIFGPHINVTALWEAAEHTETRPSPPKENDGGDGDLDVVAVGRDRDDVALTPGDT